MAAVRASRAGTDTSRRSVVPPAAGRSEWLAAVWTGAGTAVVGAISAIAAVAVCWLPASHGSGNATSALKAGLLTFLAAVHGGITVDGADASFVPLGMTLLLALIAWRAGAGLADAIGDLDEHDPVRLVLVGATQTAAFGVACLALAPLAALGTSSASFVGVALFGTLLFTLTGGLAFARGTGLVGLVTERIPAWVRPGVRLAGLGLGLYLAAGALLVGASLVVHAGRARALLEQVGPGWNGAPILLLCLLAAPNAIVAGASYLAGPGFAVGTGTAVGVTASTHGVLPAFPVLAAVGSGAPPAWMWWPVALVPVAAGVLTGAAASAASRWAHRFRDAGIAAAVAGLAAAVLAWQAGGSIGDGRLATIGASPWKFGGAVAVELAVGAALLLGVRAAWVSLRRRKAPTPVLWAAPAAEADEPDDALGVTVPTERRERNRSNRLAG